MARSYGKILATLTTDDEFNDLAGDEQTLYFRLLGHPTLSLIGKLDYRPHHWCRYARNWTRETVEHLVVALADRRYVAVDYATEELLIRTLTKHDGIPVGNAKLRKGLWAAWGSIASPELRSVAVANLPHEVFAFNDAPDAVQKIRRAMAMEPPSDHLSERVPDYLIEQGTGWVPHSPVSFHQPLATSAAPESHAGSERGCGQPVEDVQKFSGFAVSGFNHANEADAVALNGSHNDTSRECQ